MDLKIKEYEIANYGHGKELNIVYGADHRVFHSENMLDKLNPNFRTEFYAEANKLYPNVNLTGDIEYLQNIFLWSKSPALSCFAFLPVYQSLLNEANLFGLRQFRTFLTMQGYIGSFNDAYDAMAELALPDPLVVSIDPLIVSADELDLHLRIRWPNGTELEENLKNPEACTKLLNALSFFAGKDVLLVIAGSKQIVSSKDLSKFIFN